MRALSIVTESVVWVGWKADAALCALVPPIARNAFERRIAPRALV
jgi:hypothetical protein